MGHAFLITCYKDIENLDHLINDILKIKNSRIYISADTKNKNFIKQVELIKKKYKKNLYICFHQMNWGSIKHYDAFIKMLNIAIKDNCKYFHWIDGRTRIIVKPNKFIKFFRINKKITFIQYKQIPNNAYRIKKSKIKKIIHDIIIDGFINRVKYFHITDFLNIQRYKILFLLITFLFIILQKSFFIKRVYYKKYFGGVGYFSFSQSAANYLYKKYNLIKIKFKNTFIAEEVISHTILLNSANKIKKNIRNNNLIYQNWNKLNEIPAILSMEDYKKIKNKNYIFARKFSSNNIESQKLLKKLILNN
jgi:hypothetical protein